MRAAWLVLAACSAREPQKAPVSGSAPTPSAAPCDCKPGEQCVQRFDGTCGDRGVTCVPRPADCPADPANACTAACAAAYCPKPFQCEIRSPCGKELPGAFTCYGP